MQRLDRLTDTYARLLKADGKQVLEAKDLETFALAAYLTGRDVESFGIFERAHQGYLVREQTDKAVRCAFWLGLILMQAGERARGGGWIAKAERLINNEQGQGWSEKGLLLIPTALGELAVGHAAVAQKLFEQAAAIGEQLKDSDLIVLGRLGHGQALIHQGIVAKGVKLLDETMVILETEEIFPVVTGIVYCAVIETCRKVWDLERVHEWTSALTRWCDVQPGIVPFRGQCLVRRAEIIQFHGDWQKALLASKDACDLLTRPPGAPAAGEAFYRKAELLRLLGDFEEAESCYHEAAKWGRKPQPGLALLHMAQGQDDAAETSIRNALNEAKDPIKRAELLPAVVSIMIAVKQTGEALVASKELDSISNEFDAPYLYAMAAYCKGAVLLSEGSVQLALEDLQKALKFWNTLDLPYESAHTRVLKGLAYRELNDKIDSDVEFTVAKWIFEQLQAKPDMERINRLLDQNRHHKTHGLTLRELQVLRRVASGKTNKSVAGELFISQRTVDRHLSNIFNKLDVSSRVAATAFAIRNKLLGPEL